MYAVQKRSVRLPVRLCSQLAACPACPLLQAVELKAAKVVHLGPCDAASYPMAKKKQSMEFLREKAHLRSRTNTIGAVARIRNALAFATHSFFQENGFYYVHTPIITASDCEGAGEMFQVRSSREVWIKPVAVACRVLLAPRPG